MAIINVGELAYCRVQVPDLDRTEAFLLDFGLQPAGREARRRFYRGADPTPYCYVLEEGPEHFLGFAFRAAGREDLERLAQETGKSVEPIDAPGGGWRVRLHEPNGYDVDVVWGIAPASPIAVKRQPYNSASQPLLRAGELYRLERGKPTPVKRLAHVVLGTPKVRETTDWLHQTLGMITSDEVHAGPQKALLGTFIRVDQGEDYVDHHSVFVFAKETAGLNHISFECQDLDAVMADHHYLRGRGDYEHMWGIGRHLLGSQVFDYWLSPDGYIHEHWADSDRLNASAPTNLWDAKDGMITQWGEEPSERFRQCTKP